MGLFNIEDELSLSGDKLHETPGTPRASYQEEASSSYEGECGGSPLSRPPLRTLKVQYEEGSYPKHLSMFEDDESQPIYWAKLHTTKIMRGAHMEFKTHDNKTIGTASFHKTGSAKVDLKFHNVPTIMNGYFGTTYSLLNFTSQASGQKLRWKRSSQAYNLVCIDPNEIELASLNFGRSTKPCGEIEIFDPELAKGGCLLEEIFISGMSYIHLSKYMPSYAGGAGSIGLGVGSSGG